MTAQSSTIGGESAEQTEENTVIRMTLAFLAIFLIATFPATWLLMLLLGNCGLGLSYWGTLPLGILVSALLGGATTPVIIPRGA
jgi:hypothetical protein